MACLPRFALVNPLTASSPRCFCLKEVVQCWYSAVPGFSLQINLLLMSSRPFAAQQPKPAAAEMHRSTKETRPAH